MAALHCWVFCWLGGLEAPAVGGMCRSLPTWMSLSPFLLNQNLQVWMSVALDNLLGWSTVCWSFSLARGEEDEEILMVSNLWFRLL